MTGTHRGAGLDIPATGKAVEFFGFAMCQVVDDQVVECWNCFDFLGMYRQLGAEIYDAAGQPRRRRLRRTRH